MVVTWNWLELQTPDRVSRHNGDVDDPTPAPIISDLGDDVYSIDTQMAGHTGIYREVTSSAGPARA